MTLYQLLKGRSLVNEYTSPQRAAAEAQDRNNFERTTDYHIEPLVCEAEHQAAPQEQSTIH